MKLESIKCVKASDLDDSSSSSWFHLGFIEDTNMLRNLILYLICSSV